MRSEDERTPAEVAGRRAKVGGAVLCSVVVTLGTAPEPIHASDSGQPSASLGVTAIVVRPTVVSVERTEAGDRSVVVTSTDPADIRVAGGSKRELDRRRTTVTAGGGAAIVTLAY